MNRRYSSIVFAFSISVVCGLLTIASAQNAKLLECANSGEANCQLVLGHAYLNGYEVPKNPLEAEKWWRKAAEQGNADAQEVLGDLYLGGRGVPEDHQEAEKWIRKSAEQGHANGQRLLGGLYARGIGVPKDEAEALKWFRLAAEQGEPQTLKLLALMYENGTGVPKDLAEAAKWYRLLGEQGFVDAQRILGTMYIKGEGVDRDYVSGYMWSSLAEEQGDKDARRFRKKAERKMTPQQIDEAKQLVQDWTQTHYPNADTHPATEHSIILATSEMDAGAKALDTRFDNPEIAAGVAELFVYESERQILAISIAVEYVSEDGKMTIHFRIITDSLETAESGCHTVLNQMATIVPDAINRTFILDDTTSHDPDELQRVVMDRTDMLCTVVALGLDEVVKVRYSFDDGS
jgi:TPR repeat protein